VTIALALQIVSVTVPSFARVSFGFNQAGGEINREGVHVVLSDIEIAQATILKPILQLAQDRLGIPP